MSLTFVNCFGDAITDSHLAAMRAQGAELERLKRASSKVEVSTHKGWRVTGVAPGLLQEAQAAHQRLVDLAHKGGSKPPEPFDEAAWRRNAKRSAVRSKPYILQEAASQCRDLAVKAGWLEVQIQEIKKVVA